MRPRSEGSGRGDRPRAVACDRGAADRGRAIEAGDSIPLPGGAGPVASSIVLSLNVRYLMFVRVSVTPGADPRNLPPLLARSYCPIALGKTTVSVPPPPSIEAEREPAMNESP